MTHQNSEPYKSQRLNQYVALSLGVSRRTADEMITAGEIQINDQPAILGQRVRAQDKVTHQSTILKPKTHKLILLNKPTGYLCSRASQSGAPTIYKLLPESFSHLKPVGRLDKDSSGLILLTNDGQMAHQMTHPSFHKIKTYLVTLDRPLEPLHHQMINDFGINLPDGKSKMQLERQYDSDSTRWIVQMSEGRNRQIRRTFAALDYTVTKLHRTTFGDYTLGGLKRGEWREIQI